MLMLVQYMNWRRVHWTSIKISASAPDFNHFSSNNTYACIDLIHARQKKKIICSSSWKITDKNGFKVPLVMKKLNTFSKWKKNGSVNVKINHAITHQKHLTQSVCTECIIHFLPKSQSENKIGVYECEIWHTCAMCNMSMIPIRVFAIRHYKKSFNMPLELSDISLQTLLSCT